MDLREFFNTVITTDEGYFCLAHAQIAEDDETTQKTWNEEFFVWPTERDVVLERIEQLGEDKDIYFSPYLFKTNNSTKSEVLPNRTIVADLDDADVLTLGFRPTVLVETSDDRHQGYWILKTESEEHEELSKRLTYSIARCDRNGWFKGKKVRVPGTYNHKYITGPKLVRVVNVTGKTYAEDELQALPTLLELFGEKTGQFEGAETYDWLENAINLKIGPQELLASVRSGLPSRIVAQYNVQAPDRSTALWALMLACFRAGLTKDRVFHLARHSANNKFNDLRYGAFVALAKDVTRAELAVNVRIVDIKSKIADARRLPSLPADKNNYIAELAREHLCTIGTFLNIGDGSAWYIRNDIGKPISLSARSEQLLNLIDNLFGINASERESSYIAHRLLSYVYELPQQGQVSALSYYDQDTKSLLLHTGRKDVIQVTKDDITKVTNGHNGVIFPWTMGAATISPRYRDLERSWDDELFEGCLDNVLGITPKQAQAIIKTWFLALLMREGLSARPILALFGQPGAGKSTLFRRIYALLYGRDRAIGAVTKEDDFDYASATNALVVLDNVDTWARWLPDRLALSASTSEIIKRKLFTDSDVVVLKRQAMFAITAHNPKFGREDVTDRLLLLTFERLTHFLPEAVILDKITSMRGALWGAILQDVQKVLQTPMPRSGWPQFRIEDYARFGYWVATALDIDVDFCNGINQIRKEQKSFLIEEDGLLIDAITLLLDRKDDGMVVDKTAGELWRQLEAVTNEPNAFVKKYVNAVSLGKKFWTLLDSMREIFIVNWKYDSVKGSRVWTFEKKVKSTTNGVHK